MSLLGIDRIKRKMINDGTASAQLIDIGPYYMTSKGVFGSNDYNKPHIRITESGMRLLAKACKAPSGYWKSLPDEIVSNLVNYGIMACDIRSKWDFVVNSEGSVIGLLRKGGNIKSNIEVVDIIDAALKLTDLGDMKISEYSVSIPFSYFIIFIDELDQDGVATGFCVLNKAFESGYPVLFPIYKDTLLDIKFLINRPRFLRGNQMWVALRTALYNDIIDKRINFIERIKYLRDARLEDKKKLDAILKKLEAPKRVSRKINNAYLTKGMCRSYKDVINRFIALMTIKSPEDKLNVYLKIGDLLQ